MRSAACLDCVRESHRSRSGRRRGRRRRVEGGRAAAPARVPLAVLGRRDRVPLRVRRAGRAVRDAGARAARRSAPSSRASAAAASSGRSPPRWSRTPVLWPRGRRRPALPSGRAGGPLAEAVRRRAARSQVSFAGHAHLRRRCSARCSTRRRAPSVTATSRTQTSVTDCVNVRVTEAYAGFATALLDGEAWPHETSTSAQSMVTRYQCSTCVTVTRRSAGALAGDRLEALADRGCVLAEVVEPRQRARLSRPKTRSKSGVAR